MAEQRDPEPQDSDPGSNQGETVKEPVRITDGVSNLEGATVEIEDRAERRKATEVTEEDVAEEEPGETWSEEWWCPSEGAEQPPQLTWRVAAEPVSSEGLAGLTRDPGRGNSRLWEEGKGE